MDVADWLQALPTQEGLRFLPSSEEGEGKAEPKKHLTPKEFSDYFYNSPKGKAILEKLETPIKATAEDQDMIKSIGSVKYANSTITNMKLLAGRELLLWWRDKYQVSLVCARGTGGFYVSPNLILFCCLLNLPKLRSKPKSCKVSTSNAYNCRALRWGEFLKLLYVD